MEFTISFPEPVMYVEISDFSLITTGDISGTSVISLSGTGDTRTVTVNTGSGNGTIRLDVNASDTDIEDLAGNPISGGYTSGGVYTVSKTPAFIITVAASPNPTTMDAGDSKDIQYSFTELAGETGIITSYTTQFFTQYDLQLSDETDSITTNITLQPDGTVFWTESVTLPLAVVAAARADGKYAIVRKSIFSGTTTLGNPISGEVSLLIIIPPDGFTKSSPSNGEAIPPTNINLDWEPSLGATYYEVCYDSSDNDECSEWTGTYDTNQTFDDLIPNTTYYWQVRAINNAGEIEANNGEWWLFTTERTNDNFEYATDVTALSYTDSISTVDATSSPSDPALPAECGIAGNGKSTVWYKYYLANDDAISIDTLASNYDTFIAIWEGTDINDLTFVACNDDTGGTKQSALAIRVSGGHTYYIEIGQP